MDIHNWIMDIHNCIHNWIVDIHYCCELCVRNLIMGIHNLVMDIPLEGIFALGFSYQYAFIASQRIHDSNNDITSKQCVTLSRRRNDVIMTLCDHWDRTTLPLRPRLHYIKDPVHWLYCSGCWFQLGSAYIHIV